MGYTKDDLENILGCPIKEVQAVLGGEPDKPATEDQECMGYVLITILLGSLVCGVISALLG